MIESAPAYSLVSVEKRLQSLPQSYSSKLEGVNTFDFWQWLSDKQRKKLNKEAFMKTQKALQKASLEFQISYFRFRYQRHPIPRSVYKGYFYVEITPKKSVGEILKIIQDSQANSLSQWPKKTLLSLKKSNIDPNMISLKGAQVCYLTGFKEIKEVFDNVNYVTGNLDFIVRIIGEPLPVLFFLRTDKHPASVMSPLLTRFDEFDYTCLGENKYIVFVLFRSNTRPQPFCNKSSSLCYLTAPLKCERKPKECFKVEVDAVAPQNQTGATSNTPMNSGPGTGAPSATNSTDLGNSDAFVQTPVATSAAPQQIISPIQGSSASQGQAVARISSPASNSPSPMPETLYSMTQGAQQAYHEAQQEGFSGRAIKRVTKKFLKMKLTRS